MCSVTENQKNKQVRIRQMWLTDFEGRISKPEASFHHLQFSRTNVRECDASAICYNSPVLGRPGRPTSLGTEDQTRTRRRRSRLLLHQAKLPHWAVAGVSRILLPPTHPTNLTLPHAAIGCFQRLRLGRMNTQFWPSRYTGF